MTTVPPGPTASALVTSSLPSKLVNLFVSPTYVYDEVACAPHRFLNWLVPLALVSLTGLLSLGSTIDQERVRSVVQGLLQSEIISQTQSSSMIASWRMVSAFALCFAAVVGIFWSALVLWGIARFFLKSNVSFGKSLEIVGLASMIMALGTVFTLALTAATGDPGARPALSLFAGKLPPDSPLLAALAATNLFHIWSLVVITLGLARVGDLSTKEAGFWVFGYWFFLRMALALLG